MRRAMTIIISSIMIMMTANACTPRKDGSESVFRERLVRHYAEDDKAARAMNGEPLRLDITFVDLDGDGKPEAIVRLDHPAFCGSRGCAIDVVRFEADGIIVLGAFIAHEAAPRHEAIGQQRHIVVDGHVWTIRGDRLTTE
jgi:hypothetical protein